MVLSSQCSFRRVLLMKFSSQYFHVLTVFSLMSSPHVVVLIVLSDHVLSVFKGSPHSFHLAELLSLDFHPFYSVLIEKFWRSQCSLVMFSSKSSLCSLLTISSSDHFPCNAPLTVFSSQTHCVPPFLSQHQAVPLV